MNLETLPNGAVRCPDDPGEPGYDVCSKRISVAPSEAELLAAVSIGRDVVEIGTGLGVSARAMLPCASKLLTVDSDPCVWKNVWPELTKDGAHCDRSAGNTGMYDMAFIDGLHTREALLADIASVRKVLRPRAIVLFHDVELTHVREAIESVLGPVTLLAPNLGWVKL